MKKAGHLGQPQDLGKPSPPTQEESEGIDMCWDESDTPWGGREELSPADQLALEQEELEVEGTDAWEAVQEVLARAMVYVRTKNSLYEEGGEPGIAQMREEMMRPAREGGTLMKNLVAPQDIKEVLNISHVDWASRYEEMLQDDMDAIESASMPLKLNAVDISTILSRANLGSC